MCGTCPTHLIFLGVIKSKIINYELVIMQFSSATRYFISFKHNMHKPSFAMLQINISVSRKCSTC